jgi:hypothetical protein
LARNLSLAFRAQLCSPILAANFAAHPSKGHGMRILCEWFSYSFFHYPQGILRYIALA